MCLATCFEQFCGTGLTPRPLALTGPVNQKFVRVVPALRQQATRYTSICVHSTSEVLWENKLAIQRPKKLSLNFGAVAG